MLVSMYVAQEEMFVPTLSCWETLHFHAALRNRSRAKAQDLRKRMQHVLSVMGLWMVRNTQVTGPCQTARGRTDIRQTVSSCHHLPSYSKLFSHKPCGTAQACMLATAWKC